MAVVAKGRGRRGRAAGPDFHAIGDYGFLSDCHTGALVASDGTRRVALPAAVRLAERVRGAARSRSGCLPPRPHRPAGPGGAALHARLERAGDELDDGHRVDGRPRRPGAGAGQRRGRGERPGPRAGGARRAAHAGADGRVRSRDDRDRGALRAGLRLRDRGGELEAGRQGRARGRRQRRRRDAAAARRHPARVRRSRRPWTANPRDAASAPSSASAGARSSADRPTRTRRSGSSTGP